MRVLQGDPSVLYKMGKNKKHKIRKAKENEADDSSEDGILNGCPHVAKAINLSAMKKAVAKPTTTLGDCTGCSKDLPKATGRDLFGSLIEGPACGTTGDEAESVESTVCICLQCGYQGCDRNSPNKHALKHHKTPHTGVHSIIVNLTTWSTWCYLCDEEVPVGGKIKSCIDFLQKQAGITKLELSQASGRPLENPASDTPSVLPNTAGSKSTAPVSCIKVKGLSNLGNTCFFNAVMQSMSQTQGLDAILSERIKQGSLCDIPALDICLETDSSSSEEDQTEDTGDRNKALPSIQTNLGDAGQVTLTLLNFLLEMKGSTTRNGIVNPTPLFTQVCKKAPRFKGFQQQDSHELLRYLVDSIRTEEIKRGQASILKFFKLPETINPKKVDEETKIKVKEYGHQVKHTFLDSLFGGQLVSTVKCEECKSISQIFETFLDLSLPVMEEKPQRPNLILIGKKKDQITLADGVEAVGGGDVEAYTDKPSRHQDRKNKRLAKKDSKRKAKLQKSKSYEKNEKGSKEQEKVGQDSEGLSDESKVMNEEEGTAAENATGTQCFVRSERPDRTMLTTHSSNTSVESGAAHNGPKSGDQEDTDDPSDADVEDNLESDMLRVESSAFSNHSSRLLLPNGDATFVKDNASSESGLIISSLGAGSSTSNSHCLASHCTLQNGETTVSENQSKLSSTKVENLCEDLSKAKMNGVGGTSISCDVSVTNSSDSPQLMQLANGLASLTVEVSPQSIENDTLHRKDESEQKCVTDGVYDIVNKVTLRGEGNSESEVCVSFTIPLPTSENINRNLFSDKTGKDEPDLDGIMPNVKGMNGNLSSDKTGKDEPDLDDSGTETKHNEIMPNVKGINGNLSSDKTGKDVLDNSASGVEIKDNVKESEDLQFNGEPQVSSSSQEKQTTLCSLKAQHEYLKDARSYSMNTLALRYHPSPKECSILSCLNQFTAAELLTGSNKFGCKECTKRRRLNSHTHKGDKKSKDTVYSNASKQYLIFRPPAVLTLHLKRFEQTGLTSRKVNRHVDFPLLLDLAPYCSSLCLGVKEGQTKVLYALYAVVEHSGRLNGGHYTAYIKVRPGLASHAQFLHTQPPAAFDLLRVYLDRIVKSKEISNFLNREDGGRHEPSCPMDKDVEAKAENFLPPGRWFHISDSRVNEVTEATVLKAQAYLLLYERIF